MEILCLTDELRNWKPNIADISDRLIMGPQRDALEKVDSINRYHGLSLGITKTYRWSPGCMDKIKHWMSNDYLEPHMKRKMSTYFNQIDNKRWQYTRLKEKLVQLDEIMSEMRRRNQIFQDNSELVSTVWSAFMGIINDELKDNEDYFNVYIGHYKMEFNSDWRPNENQTDKPAIVFVFYLPETICNYYIGQTSYQIPVYAATLHYAIDLEELLYRISGNIKWLEDSNHNILGSFRRPGGYNSHRGTYNTWQGTYHRNYVNETGNHANNQLLHPYISSEEFSRSYHYLENFNGERERAAYCCMGDYQTDINTALVKLEFGKIYSLLYNWHTVYNSQSTRPMNNPSYMFFGKHKGMDDTFSNILSTREEHCRIRSNSTNGPKTYCDEYQCLNRKTCSYYNYDPEVHVADNPDISIEEEAEAYNVTEETVQDPNQVFREQLDNNIHGGEVDPMSTPVEETTVEEQMIIWASQRGGAINIVNNERENNG